MEWLSAARGPAKSYAQEVLWAPVLDAPEKLMMAEAGRRGSSNRPLQHLVIETLADALCFQNRREEIFACFDEAYCRLRAPEGINMYAHSLGVVLSLEWLRARPSVKVRSFVSFGTNLQLFNLGKEGQFVCPSQVAGGNWTNYFDEDDMLGWPVAGWVPARDVEVSVGGLFTGWTGLSHVGYFTTKSFWRRVAGDLPR